MMRAKCVDMKGATALGCTRSYMCARAFVDREECLAIYEMCVREKVRVSVESRVAGESGDEGGREGESDVRRRGCGLGRGRRVRVKSDWRGVWVSVDGDGDSESEGTYLLCQLIGPDLTKTKQVASRVSFTATSSSTLRMF